MAQSLATLAQKVKELPADVLLQRFQDKVSSLEHVKTAGRAVQLDEEIRVFKDELENRLGVTRRWP